MPRLKRLRAIDLFAGWGGFSLAAEQAGLELIFAANHWPLAVQAHHMNHPEVLVTEEEMLQDLSQYDWNKLNDPPFEGYDLMLSSPACQGWSTAGQVRRRRYHDNLRSTIWSTVDCVEVTRPRAFIIENVTDLKRWPLYPHWLASFDFLDYVTEEWVLDASWMGVPQTRKRLFIVGYRQWSEDRAKPRTPRPELTDEQEPFGPYMLADDDPRVADAWKDWTRKGQVGAGTVSRIEAAREKLRQNGLDPDTRVLMQDTTGHRGITLDQPIRTITCQDQWSVVEGADYRRLHVREYARAMGFPEDYRWPAVTSKAANVKGLGNAVCPPVAEQLIERVASQL